MTTLFDPLKVGALNLPNRIVMAPLTRSRAHPDTRVPSDLAVQYYSQRAEFGLIISEATSVTAMGVGYAGTPGIWSDEQTEGWSKITRAVHAKGGRMLLQLWHVGRISDPIFLDGELPVAPSAIQPKGHVSLVRPERPFVTPRALETDEIPGVIAAFKRGAENARRAGFDGVEIHGANGYLLDQFLQDSTNHRTDAYGGTREKRARLMLEVADACVDVWGADRVGMHLAPRMDSHDMGDSDRLGTFTYVARELGKRKLAFICAREKWLDDSIGPAIKDAFDGVFIANEGFDLKNGNAILAEGKADAVAFGKLAIANPDLPERFADNAPLNPWDANTFYTGGRHGLHRLPDSRAGTCLIPATLLNRVSTYGNHSFRLDVVPSYSEGQMESEMKNVGKIAAACLLMLGAGTVTAYADACSGHPHDTATALGAGGGALIGGLASHSIVGAVVGGVAGGFAGNAIARSNDCRHRYSYRDRYGYRHYYYR